MRGRRQRDPIKTSNLILLALGLFALGFIVAMTVIFCVKDAVPDTLIQYTLGAGGVEALLLAGIKISNKVKYNAWFYGHPVSGAAYPWCMAFVQWVFNQAGAKLPYLTASCGGLLTWYRRNRPGSVSKRPRPGDIVIYGFGHTGIVEAVGSGTIRRDQTSQSKSVHRARHGIYHNLHAHFQRGLLAAESGGIYGTGGIPKTGLQYGSSRF